MKYSEKELVERLCQDHKEVFFNKKNYEIQTTRNDLRSSKKSTHRLIFAGIAYMIESVFWNNGDLPIKGKTIKDYTRKSDRNINAKMVSQLEVIRNYHSSGTVTNDTSEQVIISEKLVSPADCISYEGIGRLSFNPVYGK